MGASNKILETNIEKYFKWYIVIKIFSKLSLKYRYVN